MTHAQQNRGQPRSAFTITQVALGSPLQFEPELGTIELDNLINNYVPGSAMPQQKRAQVVLEFLNSIDDLSYSHPVSIRYHVPQVLTPHNVSRTSSMPSISSSASRPVADQPVKAETLSTSKSTSALKRSREEAALPNPSSTKRLPGFSILTKDGIDITDLASRGPKTKEQRDHAALMRKLKACAACKRSKQRCDPSHHRPTPSVQSTSSSATPSKSSVRLSSASSASGSFGSISPQSSLGESFSQSPTRNFVKQATARMGQSFLPGPGSRPSLSASQATPSDVLLIDPDLSASPAQDFDTRIFQLEDMDLDSWNTEFTTFPPTYDDCIWNNHEDVFTQSSVNNVSSAAHGPDSREQVRPNALPLDNILAEQALTRQDKERQECQPDLVARSAAHSEFNGIEFDIDQWLHSTATWENSKQNLSQGIPMTRVTCNASRQDLQNPTISRNQDYILYPDSPQFDLGLDSHETSRDIGGQQLPLRTGLERETLDKDYVGRSRSTQDSQRIASTVERTSRSNYNAPDDLLRQALTTDVSYRYLPSPSLSSGREDVKDSGLSNMIASEAEAYALQNTSTLRWKQSSNVQMTRMHSDTIRMDTAQRQRDKSISDREGLNDIYGAANRTNLSPGELYNPPPVITAGVDEGPQYQSGLVGRIQSTRPQEQSIGQSATDIRNRTMDILNDQDGQQNQPSGASQNLQSPPQRWFNVWEERDLRWAGLSGDAVGGNYPPRLRISRHDMIQVHDIADGFYQEFTNESQQEAYRTPISSDIPGEDERRSTSLEMLTRQRRSLSQRDLHQSSIQSSQGAQSSLMKYQKKTSTIVIVCTLMAISLLWTMLLLTDISYSRSMTKDITVSSRNDVGSFSIWTDPEDPYRFHTRPEQDNFSLSADCFYSRLDQAESMESMETMESNHKLISRPESETLSAYNSIIDERHRDQWEKEKITSTAPSFSFTRVPISIPTLAIVPSTTKCATTWTTHIPARSTSQPEDSSMDAKMEIHLQVASQSPSSRILTDLKRTLNRAFNIGDLTKKITSLTVS